MTQAAQVAVYVVVFMCLVLAWWWRTRYRLARRALNEWRDRWRRGEKLCVVCAESFEKGDHAESDYDDATLKRWGRHRYVPGRLLPEPILLPREGPGRDR